MKLKDLKELRRILKIDLIGKKILIGKAELEVIDLCRHCRQLSEVLGQENIIKEAYKK